MTADPGLRLEPVSLRTRLWLLALAVLLPVGIAAVMVGAAFGDGTADMEAGATASALRTVGGIALIAAAIAAVIDRVLHRHRLRLDRDGLEVATTFYRRRLALAELALDQARVVDVDERTEFRPLLKTNGTSLPGFQSGWFRLRNRQRAFVARAGGSRLLWIPTTQGYGLLLQPAQPRALLDRLHALADARGRR